VSPEKTPDCLDAEALDAHLRGEGPAELREEREMHLEACALCTAELTLLREFLEGEPTSDEAPDVDWIASRLTLPGPAVAPAHASPSVWERLTGWFPSQSWGLAAAAAAMLAFFVFVVRDAPPSLPGGLGQGPPIVRSGQVAIVGPAGELGSAPARLEADAYDGAARYRFSIQEVDRSVIWSGESADPTIELPSDVVDQSLPGKTLIWIVEALDASGNTLAQSAPTRFSVRLDTLQ
jgi:anti-sigma factor RsiW